MPKFSRMPWEKVLSGHLLAAQAAGEWKWVLALLSDMEKVVEFRAEAAKGLGCYCNKISQKMWLTT